VVSLADVGREFASIVADLNRQAEHVASMTCAATETATRTQALSEDAQHPGIGPVTAKFQLAAENLRRADQALAAAAAAIVEYARVIGLVLPPAARPEQPGAPAAGPATATVAAVPDPVTSGVTRRSPSAVPQGLTAEQFRRAARELREGTAHVGGDLVIQGSRAAGTARPDSDIDFAVRVRRSRFADLVASRFGAPNPGSAKERTMLRAIETGKIQAGEAGLSRLRRSLEAQLEMDVDLSIIRRGGPFDTPPFIEVP